MLDFRSSISSKTQNCRRDLPFVPHSAETRSIFRPSVDLKTSTRLFGKMFAVVMACRELQVNTGDFHLLVRVLDPQIGDPAIHDGQVYFTSEGTLGPLVPTFILRPGLADLPIQFFLQLLVQLNAEAFPPLRSISPAAF